MELTRDAVQFRADEPEPGTPTAGGDTMTATTAPYRSSLPAGRDGFGQLLHAEWTKFRTVRGWVITAVAAALLIVAVRLPGHLPPPERGICIGANPRRASCHVAHPHVPLGPGGEAVTDTYYFVHRTLAGDGSITVRVGSLERPHADRQRQQRQRRGPGRRARAGAAVGQGRADPHREHQARLRLRRGDADRRSRGADAVRLHPRHRRSSRAPPAARAGCA